MTVYAVKLGGNATHNWIGVCELSTTSVSVFKRMLDDACIRLSDFQDVKIYPMPEESVLDYIYGPHTDRSKVLVTDSKVITDLIGG